jgi:hypothetical protein
VTVTDPGDYGMYQLEIKNSANEFMLGGISVHLMHELSYNPVIYDSRQSWYVLDPNAPNGRLQHAIDHWEEGTANHTRGAILLIYPNTIAVDNREGAHVENLIMSHPMKLQGIGKAGTGLTKRILEILGLQLTYVQPFPCYRPRW